LGDRAPGSCSAAAMAEQRTPARHAGKGIWRRELGRAEREHEEVRVRGQRKSMSRPWKMGTEQREVWPAAAMGELEGVPSVGKSAGDREREGDTA
jgi:hypothetical protein